MKIAPVAEQALLNFSWVKTSLVWKINYYL
jgi:hypothetical protein